MQTVKLIANPAAGRGRVAQCLDDIQEALRSHSLETDLVRTQAPGLVAARGAWRVHGRQEGFCSLARFLLVRKPRLRRPLRG